MKKALVIFFAFTLTMTGTSPAQSADSAFKTSTMTVTAFKSGSKLSAPQMSQVRKLVETNPTGLNSLDSPHAQ
jgi:hypothetical protein